MTTSIVTLAVAVIALLGSILSLFVGSRLVLHRERRQLVWSKEIDRFLRLEELASMLVEEIGSHKPIPDERSELTSQFNALHRAAGEFARYPNVQLAVRELHNALGRMFDAKLHREDDRPISAELGPALRKLLDACDKAIGRNVV